MQGARGVIINVTGGPDLTLTEVSEASEIVHSAAHEEANIIFGAVVNPQMEGQVKITVIATGFENRAIMAPAVQSRIDTPVDMSTYTSVRMPAEERLVANGGRVMVARRPMLDLSAIASRGAALPVAAAEDTEEESPLDVPAFLRRSE